jgi:hypothetical protein
MPVNFLPQQTADARGKPFNATIGQITDGHGRAVPLSPIHEALGGLSEELANRALLYSPVEGWADLRTRWRERQRRGQPDVIPSSLPLVTAGRLAALGLAAELFLVPSRRVVLPDPAPEGYVDVFCLRTGAEAVAVPVTPNGLPVPRELAAALDGVPEGEPVMVVLRSERPGLGEARRELRELLIGAADHRPVVAVVDFSGQAPAGSPFWELAGRNPGLIALQVEGAEPLGFGGGQIGFLTFPFDPGTPLARALEDKVKILQRAIVGSPPAASQAVLLHALETSSAHSR